MADMWIDSEASDPFGDAEGDWDYLDSESESLDLESDDSEASAAARRRRARARQLEMARRRRAVQARTGRRPMVPASGTASPRTAVAAIRQLDVENKVQNDALRSAFAARDKRSSRAEVAAVAGVVAGQIQSSFNDVFTSVFARAALSFSPLLLLSPKRRGTGAAAIASDPRVYGAALVAGVAFFGDRRGRDAAAQKLEITTSVSEIPAGVSVPFSAKVFDKGGSAIPNRDVRWSSSNSTAVQVDPATGNVTAGATKGGIAVITATSDGVDRTIVVRVV